MISQKIKNIFKLNIPTIIGFILMGYLLLLGVIIFRHEINIAMQSISPTALAVSVTDANLPTNIQENMAQSNYENEISLDQLIPDQKEHVQSILNNSKNLQPTQDEEILPGRAFLEGKTTKFLVGF